MGKLFEGGNYLREDTIFKGGHHRLEKGFDRGHYSRGYITKGRTLIKEIRYLESLNGMEPA